MSNPLVIARHNIDGHSITWTKHGDGYLVQIDNKADIDHIAFALHLDSLPSIESILLESLLRKEGVL